MKMQYYYLDTARPTRQETGVVWPQIAPESPAYRPGVGSLMNVLSGKSSDQICFKLAHGAKLTDMLSYLSVRDEHGIATAFIISAKLRNLFQSSRTLLCQYYSACVSAGHGTWSEYFVMHIVGRLSGHIDFARTRFIVKKYGDEIGTIEGKKEE